MITMISKTTKMMMVMMTTTMMKKLMRMGRISTTISTTSILIMALTGASLDGFAVCSLHHELSL